MKEMRFLLAFQLLCLPSFLFANVPKKVSDHTRMSIKERNLWRLAESHYEFSEYDQAVPDYEVLLKKHPDDFLMNYHQGICMYYSTTSKSLSITYLQKAIQLTKRDTNPDLVLHMGLAYLCVNRFSDAEIYFNIFKRIDGSKNNNQLIERLISNCENGKKYWENPAKTNIFNLGPEVNSIYPDYSGVFTNDFGTMLFTSRRADSKGGKRDEGNGYFEDVYFSKRLNNGWSDAQRYDSTYTPGRFTNLRLFFGKTENVKEINTTKHDGSICMSADGSKFYVYRSDDIWETQLIDSKWQKPTKLDKNIDHPKSYEPSAFFSKDGTTIYFVSERPEGLGKKDIFACTKKDDGTWGEPINLGSEINTIWNEDSPYLSDDGNTLYFSSEGHNSMGGYDVFKSTKMENGKWSTPENLGAPINNGGDDVFYVPDEKNKRAWYTTLNRNGVGSLDIYQILFFPQVIPLAKIRITSSEKTIAEKITIHLLEITGKLDTTFLVSSNDSLLYHYHPLSKYLLTVSGGGYLTFTDTINFSSADSSNFVLQQLDLSKFQDSAHFGERLELNNYSFNVDQLVDSTKIFDYANLQVNRETALRNISNIASSNISWTVTKVSDTHYSERPITSSSSGIVSVDFNNPSLLLTSSTPAIVYFDFNKSSLRHNMIPAMENIADWLKNNPAKTIEISGYTDSKGANEYNIKLSARRAEAVKNYLAQKGIPENQLVINANGESSPAEPNENPNGTDNPNGRQKNRRVEIRILR
jgi:outer membrane protein OmpA-like peptidoglycan-associated protein